MIPSGWNPKYWEFVDYTYFLARLLLACTVIGLVPLFSATDGRLWNESQLDRIRIKSARKQGISTIVMFTGPKGEFSLIRLPLGEILTPDGLAVSKKVWGERMKNATSLLETGVIGAPPGNLVALQGQKR